MDTYVYTYCMCIQLIRRQGYLHTEPLPCMCRHAIRLQFFCLQLFCLRVVRHVDSQAFHRLPPPSPGPSLELEPLPPAPLTPTSPHPIPPPSPSHSQTDGADIGRALALVCYRRLASLLLLGGRRICEVHEYVRLGLEAVHLDEEKRIPLLAVG